MTEHDTLIGLPTSLPIYSALKKDFPEVQAVNAMYQHGLTAIISVRNRMAGFAKSVAIFDASPRFQPTRTLAAALLARTELRCFSSEPAKGFTSSSTLLPVSFS